MEQSRYPGSTSLHNIFERHIILSMLSKINDAYVAMGKSGVTVGVISFYGSQVGDLRKAVKDMRSRGKLKALKVDVNTVDRFQGKEKQDVEIAEQNVEVLRERLESLDAEFKEALAQAQSEVNPQSIELEEIMVRPRKSDTLVETVYLA